MHGDVWLNFTNNRGVNIGMQCIQFNSTATLRYSKEWQSFIWKMHGCLVHVERTMCYGMYFEMCSIEAGPGENAMFAKLDITLY